jgi:hypothetical protein
MADTTRRGAPFGFAEGRALPLFRLKSGFSHDDCLIGEWEAALTIGGCQTRQYQGYNVRFRGQSPSIATRNGSRPLLLLFLIGNFLGTRIVTDGVHPSP